MDFISDIRKQVNSYDSVTDRYYNNNFSSTTTSIRSDEKKPVSDIAKSVEIPEENLDKPKISSSLDFFLNELESRNFFNNKLKEQQRLQNLETIREEVVNKLKELHIENKLNPVFIKELLNAIDFTYKKFKDDQSQEPENFYKACLNYIDSRRPQSSDYRSHVDF
jgi:DNA integrity scanning protein DisA with diadenylate cyclase activity